MKEEKKEVRKYWYSCTGEYDLRKFLFTGFLYAVSINDAYIAVTGELLKFDKLSSSDKLCIQVDEGV